MSSEFRHIIRFFGADLDGTKPLKYSLIKIRGINQRFASVVINKANLSPNVRLGTLTDKEIKTLEEIILHPADHGIPKWMLNRQKDIVRGGDYHVLGSDLILVNKSDIDRLKRTRSYKGIRHGLGLKLRGQRTRTTGRRGGVVGVHRKTKGNK
ncbi:MAG: 30S ribosomal protein S13 [Candidatus Helarchaeota archaeon]